MTRTHASARELMIEALARAVSFGQVRFYAGNQLCALVSLGEVVSNGLGSIEAIGLVPDLNNRGGGRVDRFEVVGPDGADTLLSGDVGTSGAAINFPSVDFVIGGETHLDSFTFTLPE